MFWHRHKWRFVEYDHGEYVWGRGDATVILFCCSVCGKTKEERFSGHLSKESVKMIADAKEKR